jgi:hypothetical protein
MLRLSRLQSIAVFSSIDPAAQLIFDAFVTPPTQARKAVINSLVVGLKGSGIWDQLDVLYVLAAADSDAALTNWKSPSTFKATEVSSPTFNADRGYTGDGLSKYLDTGWVPSTNGVKYTQNNSSAWVWSRSNTSSSSSDIGTVSGTTFSNIVTRHATFGFLSHLNVANGQYLNVATADGSGFSGSQRTSSTAVELFKNGASAATGSKTTNGVPAISQWICGANNGHWSVRQIAFAAWGAALTGKEAAFYNAVLAYMQAVGAA